MAASSYGDIRTRSQLGFDLIAPLEAMPGADLKFLRYSAANRDYGVYR